MPKAKRTWTPDRDAEIRKVYERGERGGNAALARRWQLPKRVISVRAAQLGVPPLIVCASRTQTTFWKQSERALVRAHSGEPTAQIRARLYAKGHFRSLSAIRAEVSRLRERGEALDRDGFYETRNRLSTVAIAQGLGVSAATVTYWADKGWLKIQQKGVHTVRLVHYRDLRRFLIEHVAHWDHRKADRWFLVDVLANGLAESGPCTDGDD